MGQGYWELGHESQLKSTLENVQNTRIIIQQSIESNPIDYPKDRSQWLVNAPV
jgi:hypothetical protein